MKRINPFHIDGTNPFRRGESYRKYAHRAQPKQHGRRSTATLPKNCPVTPEDFTGPAAGVVREDDR